MAGYKLGTCRLTWNHPLSWECDLWTPQGLVTILLDAANQTEAYDKAAYALAHLKETGELPSEELYY